MIYLKKYIDSKFKTFLEENNKKAFNDIKKILVENTDVQIIYTAINNILKLKEKSLNKDIKSKIVEANILEVQLLERFKFYKNVNQNIADKEEIVLTEDEKVLNDLICLEHNIHTIEESFLLKDILIENIDSKNDVTDKIKEIDEKLKKLTKEETEVFNELVDKDIDVLYRQKANDLIKNLNEQLSNLQESNERLKRLEVLNVLSEQVKSDNVFNVTDYLNLITLL